jgi:hypothetical protein
MIEIQSPEELEQCFSTPPEPDERGQAVTNQVELGILLCPEAGPKNGSRRIWNSVSEYSFLSYF